MVQRGVRVSISALAISREEGVPDFVRPLEVCTCHSARARGKVPAGYFLEAVGAKGFEVGGIRVADYHANLVYNTGTGSTADLLALLATLKNRVKHRFNLSIEEEVQYVGFDADWILPERLIG